MENSRKRFQSASKPLKLYSVRQIVNSNSSNYFLKQSSPTKSKISTCNNSNIHKNESQRTCLSKQFSSISLYNKTRSKIQKPNKVRNFSTNLNKGRRFTDEPVWKKFLRGKLLRLIKKNIILCEKKFHPDSFTESLSNKRIGEFKNKFKNLDVRNKVGIFTNKFPSILNRGNKFYTRYFDYFISPDELLNNNFTKEEIFQIKADPVYFNFGGNFNNVNFFKKRTLKETLNEEEKIGYKRVVDEAMSKSLKETKKRIGKYLDYYTSMMSRQGLVVGN